MTFIIILVNVFVVMMDKIMWGRWSILTPVHITFVMDKVAVGRVFL
jgi:hypothetical protein